MSEAPRLTPEKIEALIDTWEFLVTDLAPTLTICVMRLKNGCVLTGESNCISPENYDPKIGREVARKSAFEKIWGLEGYAMKRELAAA